MEKQFHVVAVPGSLRQASLHKMLAHAAQELAPENMSVEVLDISDLPLFNADLEVDGFPAPVEAFREKIANSDGIIFSHPEYNGSTPGVLKNAIDWASRGGLMGKRPAITMGGSPGALGGTKAQEHTRQCMMHLGMYVMARPTIAIPQMGQKFEDGRLTDEATRGFLAAQLEEFATWISRFQ